MGADAFKDIISSERYQGNIESIEWLVKLFDNFFVQVVSIVGFFIISLAFLKNILAGAYCAFPTFFDRLASYKQNLSSKKGQGAGGILFWVLSLFIPDVKSLTDFADDDQGLKYNIKTYLLKSMATGILTVMIGTIIYNGLYRDIIGKSADAGAHVLSSYILDKDFNKIIDDTMETGADYVFSYDTSTQQGKALNRIATEVYNKSKQYYGDVRTKENRSELGQNIENWVSTSLNSKSVDAVGGTTSVYDLLAQPEFSMSFQVDVVPAQPSELTAQQTDNGKYHRILFSQQIKAFGHKSTKITEAYDNSFIRLVVTFNHKELRAASGYIDVQIKAATISIGNGSNKGTYLILPEGTGGSSTAYLGDIQLSAASTSAKSEAMGGNNYSCVVLKVEDGKTLAGSYSSDGIKNMKYRSSAISSITISAGVSSASIGQSNVAVSSDGAAWQSSIPATDLKKSTQETTGNGGNNSGTPEKETNNNSGTGW